MGSFSRAFCKISWAVILPSFTLQLKPLHIVILAHKSGKHVWERTVGRCCRPPRRLAAFNAFINQARRGLHRLQKVRTCSLIVSSASELTQTCSTLCRSPSRIFLQAIAQQETKGPLRVRYTRELASAVHSRSPF